MKLMIVAIADSHGLHRKLRIPDGDILIHAGDLTRSGNIGELDEFNEFLGGLPHRHKIVIAGNHDFCFENNMEESARRLTNAVYLQDAETVIKGIKFYGSPWQPWFYDWAFNLPRGEALRRAAN
jgi:predicted phosphohydrolase